MKPSVGRIAHYVSYGTPGGEYESTCRAAIITEVHGQYEAEIDTNNWDVSLFVANPTGLFLNQHVEQDEDEKRGGTWHWVERVEE